MKKFLKMPKNKAKRKALRYMDNLGRKERDTDWYKAIDIAIQQAKQEVFNDIEVIPLYALTKKKNKLNYVYVKDCDWFRDIKNKHLGKAFSKTQASPSARSHNSR